jgi:SAM-dependent methyltransferase
MIDNETKCNICRGGDLDRIKEGVYGNPAQNIYKCRKCGHTFLGPLLSDEEEERFYSSEYPMFLLKRGDFKNTTPEVHFNGKKDEAIRRFGAVEHLLSGEKSVLEVGSASGFFLHHIKPYVKEVCGVEPNGSYSEYARKNGLETYPGLEGVGDRKFDVIFLYYVLEHVKDPVRFMTGLKALLKDKDSKIVVEVPNVDEALVSLYKSKAYDGFVWQRAHCSYFSREILNDLFHRSGLTAEFIPIQRYDISNHIHWLASGQPGGNEKYSHIFSNGLNEGYKEDLKKAWLCDAILSVAGINDAG